MALALEEMTLRSVPERANAGVGGGSEEGLPGYFRSIGGIALLRLKDEVELAAAMEAGRAAAEALEAPGRAGVKSVERLRADVGRGERARARLI
jgi:hypothetical protein